jgi:hypothetical protein
MPARNGASTEITCTEIKHLQYDKIKEKSALFGLNIFGKLWRLN